MQQATKLPESTWGFDYRNGERTPVWFVMRARRLARLNGFEGIREMAHGDSRAAVHTWLAGLKFGQDLSRSGPVIVALVAGGGGLGKLFSPPEKPAPGENMRGGAEEECAFVSTDPRD